jgi:hypothetical protein
MMRYTTPGVRFLLRSLRRPLLVFAIVGVATKLNLVRLSLSGILLLTVLLPLVHGIALVWWRGVAEKRSMARLGAQPIAKLRGSLLGNLDVLFGMMKASQADDKYMTDM